MITRQTKTARCYDLATPPKFSNIPEILETFAISAREGCSYGRQCSTGGVKIQARIPFNRILSSIHVVPLTKMGFRYLLAGWAVEKI
jgi:hypothetical protein